LHDIKFISVFFRIQLNCLKNSGVAVHTMHGCQMIGMPECDVLLGQCTVYLAKAPKSRLIHNALKAAEKMILECEGPQPAVPLHMRYNSDRKL